MKLNDVVQSIVNDYNISEKEIFDTMVFLLEAAQDKKTIFKIAKQVKLCVEYEKATL